MAGYSDRYHTKCVQQSVVFLIRQNNIAGLNGNKSGGGLNGNPGGLFIIFHNGSIHISEKPCMVNWFCQIGKAAKMHGGIKKIGMRSDCKNYGIRVCFFNILPT